MRTFTRENLSLEEAVEIMNTHMAMCGYRPALESDLVSGLELVMVDVERFCENPNGHIHPRHAAGCSVIALGRNPVVSGTAEARVVYHRERHWSIQYYAPLRDILRTGYEHDSEPFVNDTRYFIKR